MYRGLLAPCTANWQSPVHRLHCTIHALDIGYLRPPVHRRLRLGLLQVSPRVAASPPMLPAAGLPAPSPPRAASPVGSRSGSKLRRMKLGPEATSGLGRCRLASRWRQFRIVFQVLVRFVQTFDNWVNWVHRVEKRPDIEVNIAQDEAL